jgi:hypothetical protein
MATGRALFQIKRFSKDMKIRIRGGFDVSTTPVTDYTDQHRLDPRDLV